MSETRQNISIPGHNGREFYSRAELYDIAYDWDVTQELQFILTCMEFFGNGVPHTLLEPACGTGRNMECLARMGHQITGYDVSREALDYAAARLKREGLLDQCQLHEASMQDFQAGNQVDGAFVTINSFRYLISEEDVARHLSHTRDMLKAGAVYVIDLSYAMPARRRPKIYRWDATRGDTHVEVVWETREDRAAGLSHETCTLNVSGPDGDTCIETRHLTRLWLPEDFVRMTKENGFTLEAVFDAQFRQVPEGKKLDGNLDNLYHVLKRS